MVTARIRLAVCLALASVACKPPAAPVSGADAAGDSRTLSLAAALDAFTLKSGDTSAARIAATEVVEATMRRLGYKTEIDEVTGDAAEQQTLFGRYRAAFPLARTKDKEEIFLFSDPVYAREGVSLHLVVARNAPGAAAFIEHFNRTLAELPEVGVAP